MSVVIHTTKWQQGISLVATSTLSPIHITVVKMIGKNVHAHSIQMGWRAH